MTAQEKPTSPNDQSSAGSSQSTSPRTEAGAELIFYLRGALIAYPNDRAEAILAGAREYIVRIEREAVAATPSLPDVRYALGLVKRIHSAAEEWTKYDEDTPGDAEQAIQRIGKSVRAELGLVIEALARLDEGSATPDQGKGEPR